ncbi:MAG: hypothetical protein V7L22_01710 [Nostoc sp.]|uniref:hypothetical protein n=1 Tax=Nostoc sp. TaxID=1180 RepID=UPI002FFA6596
MFAQRLRELQEINYPILWGGQDAHPVDMAGKMPTPQELIEYFFICQSLIEQIQNPKSKIDPPMELQKWVIITGLDETLLKELEQPQRE